MCYLPRGFWGTFSKKGGQIGLKILLLASALRIAQVSRRYLIGIALTAILLLKLLFSFYSAFYSQKWPFSGIFSEKSVNLPHPPLLIETGLIAKWTYNFMQRLRKPNEWFFQKALVRQTDTNERW